MRVMEEKKIKMPGKAVFLSGHRFSIEIYYQFRTDKNTPDLFDFFSNDQALFTSDRLFHVLWLRSLAVCGP